MGRVATLTLASAVVAMLLPMIGCSGDGLTEIEGKVTLDGQPLTDGAIEFRPPDDQGPTAGAVVKDGYYQVRMAPAKYQVVITAFRTVGEEHAVSGDPSSPMVPKREEVPLQQYTQASATTVDVSPADDLDFALRSSP